MCSALGSVWIAEKLNLVRLALLEERKDVLSPIGESCSVLSLPLDIIRKGMFAQLSLLLTCERL